MKSPAELDRAALDSFPLPPVANGDKNSHGRILVIAGCREVAGAPLLTAMAAMRAGAGKLRIATVESSVMPLMIAMPEARVYAMPEDRGGGFASSTTGRLAELAEQSDAVVAGPGMVGREQCSALAAALCRADVPLVLDAALLHALPKRESAARRARRELILLPHHGEMASLLGCSEQEVAADPLGAGRAAAARYDAATLVKGAESHVVAPDGSAWLFRGGSPGLGVSGSGDTLAGIVGGLLARGANALTALLWAVYLHGEAGRRLSQKIGPVGFLAREVADEVPALLPR